ncbi:15829_t:CDS:1, partial [Gigaspora margarita]
SETIIRNQISQYFATSLSIIRTANFFLSPGSPNSRSSKFYESSNSTNSQDHRANSSSSYLSSEEQNLASNVSAQCQALNLIKEAITKVNKYENLLINASDKDLRHQIYGKLKDSRAINEKEKKYLSLLKRHAVSQAKLQEKKQRQLDEGII